MKKLWNGRCEGGGKKIETKKERQEITDRE